MNEVDTSIFTGMKSLCSSRHDTHDVANGAAQRPLSDGHLDREAFLNVEMVSDPL